LAEVIWTRRALRELERIRAYVGEFSPLASQRLSLRIYNAGLALSDAPLRGRAVRSGLRELVVVTPYIIRYRVFGDVVEIVEIRHGAQRPD